MAQIVGNPRYNQYIAVEGQTQFFYTFLVSTPEEIKVQRDSTTLVLNLDYTVQDTGNPSGGSITLTVGATAGQWITLTGNTKIQRLTIFSDEGPWYAAGVNQEYNILDNMVTEIATDLGRVLQQIPLDPNVSVRIPNPEANKALKWNADGTQLINSLYDPDSFGNCVQEACQCRDEAAVYASEAETSAAEAAASASDAEYWANQVDLSNLEVSIIPKNDNSITLGNFTKAFLDVNCYYLYSTYLGKTISPKINNLYDIGTDSLRLRKIYVNDISVGTGGTAYSPIPLQMDRLQYTTQTGYVSYSVPANTIPQYGTGLQLFSKTITPIKAGNKILIKAIINYRMGSTGSIMTASLFKGTGPNALTANGMGGEDFVGVITVSYQEIVANLNPIIYSVEVGCDGSLFAINYHFGGVQQCSFEIYEFNAS